MAGLVKDAFAELGFGPDSSPLPPGWALHADTGYYVHDELLVALFAHPVYMRRVTAGVAGGGGVAALTVAGTSAGLEWSSGALSVMDALPAEDRHLRMLVGGLFALAQRPGHLERIRACRAQFKKLVLTLDTSRKLLLAGDRANAARFRNKVSALIPECIQQGDVLFEQEKYAEAVEHFLVAGLVYLTAGKRFRLACGQILDLEPRR